METFILIHIISTDVVVVVVVCRHSQEWASGILCDVIVTVAIHYLIPKSEKEIITLSVRRRTIYIVLYRTVIDAVVVVGRRPACELL